MIGPHYTMALKLPSKSATHAIYCARPALRTALYATAVLKNLTTIVRSLDSASVSRIKGCFYCLTFP